MSVAPGQHQLEDLAAGHVAGQLDGGGLPRPIQSHQHHVTAGLAEDAGRSHDVLQGRSEEDKLFEGEQYNTLQTTSHNAILA